MKRHTAVLLMVLAGLGSAWSAPKQSAPIPIRGIKGLWWEGLPKYRLALPWVASHGMNFLMLCYSSFPASGKDWRSDYTADEMAGFRAMAKEADRLGVMLCLSFNPGIWSQPSLSYSSEEDFGLALRKVRAVHATGIRWYALCLDDINRELTPEDKQRFGTLQAAQAHFVNRLWREMEGLSPRPRLIFCPSAYTTADAKAHIDYTRAIGDGIDPEVMLFWTGPEVCSPTITGADAREIAALYRRKPFVWDNYPVNDMFPWRPLLSPVRGRSADLPAEVSAYIANPMKQWHISTLPLATLAAWFRNPASYDPDTALESAIAEYHESNRDAVRLLAALYGHSFWGQAGFPPKPITSTPYAAKAHLKRYELLRLYLIIGKTPPGFAEDVMPTLDADIAALKAASNAPVGQESLQ